MSYFPSKKSLELVQLGYNNYSVYKNLVEKGEMTCQKARDFG